jgi:hypothetical protein
MAGFFIHLYVRIKPKWICLTSVRDEIKVEDIPQLGLNEHEEIEVVGRDVERALTEKRIHKRPIIVREGFNHPRAIINDFEVAAKLIQHFTRRYLSLAGSNFAFAELLGQVRLILHPLERIEGELTEVAAQALYEIGRLTARRVYVWSGQELFKNEIATLKFPPEGKVFTSRSMSHLQRRHF